MPYCAAFGCTNSSDKGIKMNSFPKDPNRRSVWMEYSRLTNPSVHAVLCEFHFASNMWEKTRVDGTRKLRRDAIPTIFGEEVLQFKTFRRVEPVCCVDSAQQKYMLVETDNSTKDVRVLSGDTTEGNINDKTIYEVNTTSKLDHVPEVSETLQDNASIIRQLQEKCKKLEKLYLKSERQRNDMKRRHRQKYKAWRKTVDKLQKEKKLNDTVQSESYTSLI